MTNPTLASLRALAERATPGEWRVWTSNSVRRITVDGQQDGGVLSAVTTRDGMPDLYGANRDNDLAYIAAANPATIIQLLDSHARLERLLGEVIAIARAQHSFHPDEAARIDAIERESTHAE